MFSDMAILHRNGSRAFAAQPGNGSFVWQTCLRSLLFGDAETLARVALEPGDELVRGMAAYQLCLEIACGLRSPLVGETEVLGQFKNACLAFELPATPWGTQFRRFAKSVCEDAKKIRQTHLDNLGSQSYGSVVRREIRGLKRVHVLGAGQLVEEMLPWLAKDGVELRVHARDPLKARAALASVSTRAEVSALREGLGMASAQALIIAAPVPAAEIDAWLASAPAAELRLIVDLRADSATDRVSFVACQGAVQGATLLTLPQTLALVDSNQAKVQERKRAALAHVERLVDARERHVEYRPFGWDDVCA